jgi:hypothetical protein
MTSSKTLLNGYYYCVVLNIKTANLMYVYIYNLYSLVILFARYSFVPPIYCGCTGVGKLIVQVQCKVNKC